MLDQDAGPAHPRREGDEAMSRPRTTLFLAAAASIASMVGGASAAVGSPDQADHKSGGCGVLFDDFHYTSATDPALADHGWNARSEMGGPGVPDTAWPASNVSSSPPGVGRSLNSGRRPTARSPVRRTPNSAERP